MIGEGRPGPGDPVLVQVSRWDRLKDMAGVMRGFADHVAPGGDGYLILVGPAVKDVSDDPEGAAVYGECLLQWRDLNPAAGPGSCWLPCRWMTSTSSHQGPARHECCGTRPRNDAGVSPAHPAPTLDRKPCVGPVITHPVPLYEASSRFCGSHRRTRSRNPLISAVRRPGCTQSSANVRVRISLASGSCRASLFASANEWIRSIPCPRTSAGAVMARRWSMVGAIRTSRTPCSTAAVSSGSEAAALMNQSTGPSLDEGRREATRETSRSTVRA